MSNANIDLAVSYYEALNRRDFDAYNPETVKFFDHIWPTAFSDVTIEGINHLSDGNRVACHNRATGTHDGTLLNPQSGDRAGWPGHSPGRLKRAYHS